MKIWWKRCLLGVTCGYALDIENRLKTYKHGTSTIASYTYDDAGERNKKTVAQSGITTRFVGALYEEDNTGAKVQHVFAGSTRVASIAPTGIKYTHGDHLGSRNVVTDAAGLEVDHIDYRPFGEINRHDAVASEEGHHFTDQYRDDETELYYYGARYYNPKVGRFVTPDWIVQAPGNSQSLNRYSYVLNNPVNLIDPTGNIVSIFNSFNDGLNNFSNFGSSILRSASQPSTLESLFSSSNSFDYGSLARTGISLGADFTPIIGAGKSVAEVISGKDFITGEKVDRRFAAAGIALGLVGAKGIVKTLSKSDEVVDLFRAVSKAELDDIDNIKAFRPDPKGFSYEGKQFGLDATEVKKLSESLKDATTIIKVTVPRSTFRALDATSVDSFILKSGSVTAQPGEQLELLNDTIINIQRIH